MRAKTGFLTSEPRAWARWAGSASFWVGPGRAYLMRTIGQKWASYQSVKRVYTVNPVYRPKELRQLSFGPKNELNRLFGNLDESLATRVSDSQGQHQATCREGFM